MFKSRTAFMFCLSSALLALSIGSASAANEINLKPGQSVTSFLFVYYRDNCTNGDLGKVEIKNPENAVITAKKSRQKVVDGGYCEGKTMNGWQIRIAAKSKGKSCGWFAINAANLGGSAIGSSREKVCVNVN